MEGIDPVRQEAPASNTAELDRWLDLALEETFPASDPISSGFVD